MPEVERLQLLQESRIRVEDGKPIKLTMLRSICHCEPCIPFPSSHAVAWRIEVEGRVSRWPSFCRKFPVVVYPRAIPAEKAHAMRYLMRLCGLRPSYRPHETIQFDVLVTPPVTELNAIEVSVLWLTQGKGQRTWEYTSSPRHCDASTCRNPPRFQTAF